MSTNISNEKREKLINEIKAVRNYIAAAPQDENTGRLLVYLSEIEKEVRGKKYGLAFEEHREWIDGVLASHVPVLAEEKELFLDNGGQVNFLIEGDNLASLQLLEKTHRGKIDLIYIDPPYNTGNNDFIYDDKYVDTTDYFRHSKWLSFMKKRLDIAKRLLSKSGLIVISIDDNEQAQAKILCDEIFGDGNFLLNMCVNRTSEIAANYTVSKHEYALIYVKDIGHFDISSSAKYTISRGTVGNPDQTMPTITFPAGLKCYGLADGVYETTRKIENSSENVENFDPIVIKNGELACPVRLKARWRSSNDMRNFFKNGCRPTKAKINGEIVEIYFNSDRFVPQIKKKTFEKIPSVYLENRKGSVDLKKLGLDGGFSFPKAVSYITYLLGFTHKSATVLDFFAGSGTTGHAVMKLNSEDGGDRKFILCASNENNICRDITYERLKQAVDGEGFGASLKYYKVEYIPAADKLYYEYADSLSERVKELVELENGINFTGNGEIAVLADEEQAEEFFADGEKLKSCKKIYIGHDVLLSGSQEYLIESNNIQLNVIPEYYYKESEA